MKQSWLVVSALSLICSACYTTPNGSAPTAGAFNAGPAPAGAPTALSSSSVPAPPAKLGRYSRGAMIASQNSGTAYNYSDGSASVVTVNIYPAGSPEIAGKAATPEAVATYEGHKFSNALLAMVKNGVIRTFQVQLSKGDSVMVGVNKVPGHVTTAATTGRRGEYVEINYLFLVRENFLNIRATLPARGWMQTDVPTFARQLAISLSGG